MTNQSALRIKSYFAPTVVAAIAQARQELGAEALLLNTRKLTGDAGQPAGYEVVFGLPPANCDAPASIHAPAHEIRPLFEDHKTALHDARPETRIELRQVPSAPARDAARAKAAEMRASQQVTRPINRSSNKAAAQPVHQTATRATAPQSDDLAGELEKLHSQIDEIRGLLVRSTTPQIAVGRTVPELADVYSRLIASGVDAAIGKDIIDRLEATMATDAFFLRAGDSARTAANRWKALRFDAARLEGFVRSELECRVPIEPMLGADGERGAVVVMVGPTGAGKTTSIMKLAASNLVAGRRVRILSLDASRPGQNHLQSFASNLGLAYSVVQSVHALPAVIGQSGEKDLVFIDTPGYPNTGDRSAELAALVIQKIQPADVHLVTPGYMKGADLRRCIRKYEVFRPTRILVTKLDETDTLGSVFSEAAEAKLALSFFANGMAIPEDIRPAATEDLLSLAFERKVARAQCA